MALALNTLKLYEHKNFAEGGRIKTLQLSDYTKDTVHSLHAIDFKDSCLL
jgi:hypothetical protein